MRHSMLLIHPTSRQTSNDKSGNIFNEVRMSESLPSIQKALKNDRQAKLYDFVGSAQFKKKKFFADSMKSTDGITHKSKDRQEKIHKSQPQLEETMRNFSKIANSTINRQTILSKLSKNQVIEATKQKRNIDRYREYQDYWDNQAGKMKTLLNKKRPSLIQQSNRIMVEDNPDKTDIVNNFIVHYWQMSLRNHNPILMRHIKGHKYGQVELQQLLQRKQGIEEVEGSIPKLPLQALKKVKRRQLSLTGRSKSISQNQSLTERNSMKFTHQDVLNQEQVYKISYQGDKKWLGTEGF